METKAEGSSRVRNSPIWRNIWQLHIPNAEKHFLWRACHDILPTRVNMCSCKVIMDPSCPICMREFETVFHTLWQCPSASDVVEAMFSKHDRLEFLQFVGIARRIWLRRNEVIHGRSFLNPNRIVQQATQAMEVFQTLMDRRKITAAPAEQPTVHTWMASPHGWFKANWDARVDRRKGCVGFGIVIRDHLGQMWASKCQTCHGFLDPPAAEAVASFMVAQLCTEMGIRQVQLEGDAKNLIDAITSNDADESGWGQLTKDIRFTLRSIPVWEMRYTRREGNRVAHILARLAMHETMNTVCLYNPPDCIRDILQAEISVL
ncbi:uncharacterized protein LOC132169849 [Corylus avellana]|uniref:uncharacterized protein LOC132169849 n=1 Tax=Corylus avellana TaxID=13451 RepID=UPI00286C00CD|nr:uncharacterized protein LOC132169849 [Corylus avellana]